MKVLLLLLLISVTSATDLFEYGADFGDAIFDQSSASQTPGSPRHKRFDLSPTSPIYFFGENRSFLKIFENGVVAFEDIELPHCPSSSPTFAGSYIAPYWVQADLAVSGKIYYRQIVIDVNNRDDYQDIVNEINTGVEDLSPSVAPISAADLKSIVVITWENMKPKQTFFTNFNHLNTFQLALVSTPTRTYAMVLYKRLDYYRVISFNPLCFHAAVAGIRDANASPNPYQFIMTQYFYLQPYNMLLNSNIKDFKNLRRYVMVVESRPDQPSPPAINCIGDNDVDPYCHTGIPPFFCLMTGPGTYAHPGSCKEFVLCGQGGTMEIVDCEAGTYYQPFLGVCDHSGYYACNFHHFFFSDHLIIGKPTDYNPLISIRSQITMNQLVAIHNNTCVGKIHGENIIDISSCDHYLSCSNSRSIRMVCPLAHDGNPLYYNPVIGGCDYQRNVVCDNGKRPEDLVYTTPRTSSTTTRALPVSSAPPPGVCDVTANGNGIDPADCTSFYSCTHGKAVHKFTCQSGLLFNPRISACDYPSNVICRPACSSQSNIQFDCQDVTPNPLCEAGTFSPTGRSPCLACKVGEYQSNSGSTNCEKCPDGKTTYDVAMKSPSDCVVRCPPGSSSRTGLAPCSPCPVNTFQPLVGQTVCAECENGTDTNGTGSTICLPAKCPPGKFSFTGREKCLPCPLNTVQPLAGQTSCIPCPSGRRTASNGAITCDIVQTECSPGFISSTSFEPCTPCEIGFYQPNANQKRCLPCQDGTTTSQEGSITCDIDACPPGFISPIPFQPCAPCEVDFYQPQPAQESCLPCQDGTTTDQQTGARTCSACRREDIVDCFVNPCDSNPCEQDETCVADYCKGCNFKCVKTDCPAGDIVQCLINPCDLNPCAQDETCTSNFCGGCNHICEKVQTECSPGFISSTGFEPCTPCEIGFYQPNANQKRCLPCQDGTTTSQEGSITCDIDVTPCPPGFISPTGFQPGCTPCEVDFYQPQPARESCLPCQDGTTTDQNTGATTCSACRREDIVDCLNPCDSNPCNPDETCVADYCKGCNFKCVKTDCPAGDIVQCLINPCDLNPCAQDETCTSNFCGGCNHVCEIEIELVCPAFPGPPPGTTVPECQPGEDCAVVECDSDADCTDGLKCCYPCGIQGCGDKCILPIPATGGFP